MSYNSGIIGPQRTIKMIPPEGSGVHNLFNQYNNRKINEWPLLAKVTSFSGSNGTNLPEGSATTFTVVAEGVASDATLYYSIETVSGTTLVGADFDSGSLTGSFSLSSNSGTFSVTPVGDGISESNVALLRIRTDSISGPIIFTSGNYDMTDAAAPVGTDITTNWYEISNRFIDSGAYMGNSSDYNGSYDVGEVQTDFTGSGRIYIGIKVTAATTYYNDISIAGIQVLNSSKNSIIAQYIFYTSSGGSGTSWTTATTQESGSSTQGIVGTPTSWSSKSYYSISTSTGTNRFSWASSTGSSYTGTADGISSTYTGTIASLGDAQIAQAAGTWYAYRETSGATRWSTAVMRSPTLSFGSGGYWIRVIHALAGRGGSYAMDPTDSLYISVV